AVLTPACLSLLLRVIACPFLLIIHGITIGLTGDPSSPIVDANGMPINMWVAWFSPRLILSRMTAHDASFEITELIPNFLKYPSSCAITIDEQSVSAMMPKRTFGVSGESSENAPPAQPRGTPASVTAASDWPVFLRNVRREYLFKMPSA